MNLKIHNQDGCPVAVARYYSFENSDLLLFKTKNSALNFIKETKEEEINANLSLGYREVNRLTDEPQTFAWKYSEDGSWFKIEELRSDGTHDTSIWHLIEHFEMC